MRLLKFSVLPLLLLLLVVGCAGNSPLVGTWAGTAKVGPSSQPMSPLSLATGMLGTILNGPCTLQINADGKGFLKIASLPERPVDWSESGGKIVLRTDEPAPSNASDKSDQNDSIVGTLSSDNQTLTLDFGVASAELKKEAR